MWSTPSSIARRSTPRAPSGSRGGPKTPGPASCIAPKPMRLTGLSPMKDVLFMSIACASDRGWTRGLAVLGATPPALRAWRAGQSDARAEHGVRRRPIASCSFKPQSTCPAEKRALLAAWRLAHAPVSPYAERDEHREDAADPCDGAAERSRRSRVERVGAGRVCGERHGTRFRERLQPVRHRGDRHENGAGEDEREQDDEAGRLSGFGAAHGQRDERKDPAKRKTEGADDRKRADRLHEPRLEAKTEDVSDADHQQDDQYVADQVRRRASDQHRRARHRHGAEAVD